MKKVLIIFLALILCFSFSAFTPIPISAAENRPKTEIQTEPTVCTEASIGNSINLYVETYNHPIGAEIDLVIYTSLSNEIVNISFFGDGFALADDFQILGDEIHFSVTHTSTSDKPYLSVNITLDNEIILFGRLFGVVRDNYVFVNPHSYGFAEKAYLKFTGKYDAKVKTLNELKERYKSTTSISSSTDNVQVLSINSENISTITGQITWQDANAHYQPLRFCKIEFYERNETSLIGFLGETYTDKNGNYTIEFTNNVNDADGGTSDVTIVIYAQGADIAVCDASGAVYWYWLEYEEESSLKDVPVGATLTIDRAFDIPDDYAIDVDRDYFPRALQIVQAGICASMYYEAMKGTDVEDIDIVYPHLRAGTASVYDPQSKAIFVKDDITGESFLPFSADGSIILPDGSITLPNGSSAIPDGFIDSFESWDVITHEYGHYVSDCEEITDNPGAWHAWGDMSEHYKNHFLREETSCGNGCALKFLGINTFSEDECKYKGGAIAWAEGYATFFGELSQQYFNANYINSTLWPNEIPTFADRSYYAYNFSRPFSESAVSIETNTYNGESSELGVQRILYDMYDYSPNEGNDNLALGHQTIWNYIMASGATTLYKFIDYYKTTSSAKSQFTYLGEILAAHKLTAAAPTISSLTADSPTVSFVWDEPNDNGYYNKRKFQVNFYDESYNLVGSTTPQAVTLTSDNGTITVDSDLWETVISSPSCIYVSLTVYECNGDINTPMGSDNITSYESAYSLYFSSSHVHSYTYSFAKYNSSDHKAYCHCGAYIYENHSFVSDLLKSTCRNCGYSTTSHVPVIKQGLQNPVIDKNATMVYYYKKKDI